LKEVEVLTASPVSQHWRSGPAVTVTSIAREVCAGMPTAAAAAASRASPFPGRTPNHNNRLGTAAAAAAVRVPSSRRASRRAHLPTTRGDGLPFVSSASAVASTRRGGVLPPPRASTSSSSSTGANGEDDAGADGDPEGQFSEFARDDQGRPIDNKGAPIKPPENEWVQTMEKEWAETDYDERFFDDDWDDVNPASAANVAKKASMPSVPSEFPFKDIHDDEWMETNFTWEGEEADDSGSSSSSAAAAAAAAVAAGGAASSSSSSSSSSEADGWSAPVQDMTPSEEASMLGFDSRLEDADEPEGPPAVLLAGFRAEEIPRIRELLDELGGAAPLCVRPSRCHT